MTEAHEKSFTIAQADDKHIFVVIKEGKPEHAFTSKEKAINYALGGKFSKEQLDKLNSGEPLTSFNGYEIVGCNLD